MNGTPCIDVRPATLLAFVLGCILVPGASVFAQAGAGPRIGALEESGPIVCDESKTIRLEGVKISADGIELSKGCRLVLIDSVVDTDGWAVRLRDDSVLMVRYSILRGSEGAYDLQDTARLRAANSVMEGSIRVAGNATYDDRGGNSRGLSSAADAGTSGKLQASEPLKCVGRETLVVDSKSIDVDDHGLVVQGPCTVRIINSRIKAKDRAIVVQGSPTIIIQDSEITAEGRAFILVGNPMLRIRGSKIVGGIHKVGKPVIQDDGGNAF